MDEEGPHQDEHEGDGAIDETSKGDAEGVDLTSIISN
jgi:hypothetical protein